MALCGFDTNTLRFGKPLEQFFCLKMDKNQPNGWGNMEMICRQMPKSEAEWSSTPRC